MPSFRQRPGAPKPQARPQGAPSPQMRQQPTAAGPNRARPAPPVVRQPVQQQTVNAAARDPRQDPQGIDAIALDAMRTTYREFRATVNEAQEVLSELADILAELKALAGPFGERPELLRKLADLLGKGVPLATALAQVMTEAQTTSRETPNARAAEGENPGDGS